MSSVLALARPEIAALEPYQHAKWDPSLTRLHANENPWRVTSDTTRGGLNRYPEPQPHELIERLAELYGVSPAQVLAGRGSDEGIDLLVRGFCRAGQDGVMVFPPTFGMYKVAARIQGAEVVDVPLVRERGFALDEAALVAAWRPGIKLIFFCSPNNPTGNLVDAAVIEHTLERLAGQAVVVVDEAYVEFSPARALTAWLPRYPNLVLLRTLSKAYGLAGARCGAVLASPEIIGLLRRMIPPYALPVPTIEAVLDALAPARLKESRRRVGALLAERERLAVALAGVPLVRRVWPSDANFLLVECHDAARFLEAGISGGMLVRDVRSQPGLGDCVRVTVGTREENDRLIASVEAA